MKKPKAIDLFCGAGGLTLGLRQAGFDVVAAVELDSVAWMTYRANHSRVHAINDDITNISPRGLMAQLGLKKGELDLLAGCPPCQGFSTLRTRNKQSAVSDKRNDLIFEFLRFVEQMLPKAVMMENVPALAKNDRIKVVLARLQTLGYLVDESTVTVQDASAFGVPQRRRRMIMLTSRLGKLEPAKRVAMKKTVREVIASLPRPGKSSDPLHSSQIQHSEKVTTLIKHVPKDGGSRADLPQALWLDCHKRYPDGFRDVYGRMKWDDVAPTITGGCVNPSKGRFLHPEQDRAISLREAALLQTFPENYFFPIEMGRDRVALMIGNALPPEFIRRHASTIRKHLDRETKHD
ncbi:DNA cytosine methyltransferase [Paraburkholderia sediminicola]|uniref:DNA cytosine methyltransferase n=1 Tax=Paraburkholderia rhynchosiae TaxID=487049 RepID=A0ACC7N9B8_9BURK